MKSTILIIDDEIGMCRSLAELLEKSGYTCLFTTNPHRTLPFLEENAVDLLILDVRMPGLGGIDLLKSVKTHNPDLPVIMITGYPAVDTAVTAMRFGAVNFFPKPLPYQELLQEIKTVLGSREKISAPPPPSPLLESANREMREVIEVIHKVSPTKAPVIITGESGTGKELAAGALHHLSARRDGPFVKVNCAAIPDSLLESELFGHEKGSFTDAKTRHKGKFEAAHGGSIFLDEIGDMNLKTQAKILRILQEQEFQRLGGHEVIKTDTRFIAATNKDIPRLIEEGLFREDLYYRLSVICIHLPPLKDRLEDLPVLINHFLMSFGNLYGKNIRGISSEVEGVLYAHTWPGNIRELKNCLERAVIFCDGDTLKREHLPKQYKEIHGGYLPREIETARNALEKEIILKALSETGGRRQEAAERLKMHRKTLYNKMKRLGIE